MKLARAQQLLGQLATKSATLNMKVWDVQEGVSNIKCGFDTLKDDVTVLETARSEEAMAIAGLEQHDNDAASQLSGLLGAVEEEKERVRVLKEFLHPCGHGSWKRVEYLVFRDVGTVCPDVFASGVHSERPYTCSNLNPNQCNMHTIQVHSKEYTKVCGRVRAYGVGLSNGFIGYHDEDQGIDGAYVNGVSLTHGDLSDPTHIWSFAIGLAQIITPGLSGQAHCPCDGGAPPPGFVGGAYFCESPIETEVAVASVFHLNNVLWDGEECGTNSDCCTRLSHPFFVKQLEQPTTDDIDLRLCKGSGITDVALELVEIYIQ